MVSTGVASAAEVEQAWADNKLAQVLYHDWEAQTYDEKWSISFDDRCTTVVRDRFLRVLESTRRPGESLPYGRTLELGAGTGFFSLNLKLAGLVDELHVSDLSPGMVEAAKENARRLGFVIHRAEQVLAVVAGHDPLDARADLLCRKDVLSPPLSELGYQAGDRVRLGRVREPDPQRFASASTA